MKIGYIERCDCPPEREAFLRFKRAFEAQGDSFYFLNLHGYSLEPTKCYADDLNLDFCIVTDYTDLWQRQLPDCPCLFLKWVPSGYLPFWYNKGFFYKIINFDFCLSNCTTDDTKKILHVCGDPKIFFYPKHYLVASPSEKDCLEPLPNIDRKLFYVGINTEKRFSDLLYKLDITNNIELYGPKSSWEGYVNYKGEIPTDGLSLLKQINKTGICLALISKEHYRTGHITSRLWEGLAAGSVCITPDMEEIKKDFGDTLYYIDINLPEKELTKKIADIVKEINADKHESYLKAVKAQKIFKEKYSAERMVEHFKEAFESFKHDLEKEGKDRIDIIAYVNSKQAFTNIVKNIQKQAYNNKFIHFITDKKEFINEDNLKGLSYQIYEFDTSNRGEAFNNIQDNIFGKAFVFIDENTYWQFRFLYKMKRILDERKLDFVYSGTFYKQYNKKGQIEDFHYLLTENTEKQELLAPLQSKYFQENDYLELEEKFALGSVMFSSETLKAYDPVRLSFFYNSPHFYFAIKSLLRDMSSGDFSRIYCSGYECRYNDNARKAKHGDEFYIQSGRPGQITSAAVLYAFVFALTLKDNINIEHNFNVKLIENDIGYLKQVNSLMKNYLKSKIFLLKIKRGLHVRKSKRKKYKERIKELRGVLNLLKIMG